MKINFQSKVYLKYLKFQGGDRVKKSLLVKYVFESILLSFNC